jgi:hypothetical protein
MLKINVVESVNIEYYTMDGNIGLGKASYYQKYVDKV